MLALCFDPEKIDLFDIEKLDINKPAKRFVDQILALKPQGTPGKVGIVADLLSVRRLSRVVAVRESVFWDRLPKK